MSTFLPLTRMWPCTMIWRAMAGLGKAKTIDHVVKAQFGAAAVFTRDALHVGRLEVVTVELFLQHTVNKLDLLLFLSAVEAVLETFLAALRAFGIALRLPCQT